MVEAISIQRLKAVSLFAIPFFTICGGLYQLFYWGTFDLNGLEYLDVSTIIKSSVLPILSVGGIYLVMYVSSTIEQEIKIEHFPKLLPGTLLAFAAVAVTIWWFFKLKADIGLYFLWVYFSQLAPSLVLFKQGLLKNDISDQRIRLTIIKVIVMTVLFSIAAGRCYAQGIFLNVRYKYCVMDKGLDSCGVNINDTLKYIALTNHNLFLTDLTNSRIVILNKYDTLTFFNYEK